MREKKENERRSNSNRDHDDLVCDRPMRDMLHLYTLQGLLTTLPNQLSRAYYNSKFETGKCERITIFI